MGPKNLPARERQARPLTALPTPELQAEAWSNAQSAAGKDQPSAKDLRPRGLKNLPATERQARHADRRISFVSLIENLKPLGFKNLPATERQARHADRRISFAGLIENLKPMGPKNLPATERQARHADRRISFAGLIENLKPMGPKNLPARERQARPLTALPTPELQAEAWSNAQSAAGKDQPSAKEFGANWHQKSTSN
ncbi:hypothetical protein [Chromatium okenii]|nr:hypothetical protein [Chromatium okenii]